MVLDPNQTSAPTQNDQTIGSLQSNVPDPQQQSSQQQPVPANSINSLYGGFQEYAQTQETVQQEYQQPSPEKIQPEALPTSETLNQSKARQEMLTNIATLQQTPAVQASTPHVENKVTNTSPHHPVSENADQITKFADEDEEKFITGIVTHHANH